jgi:hypothetical protein
MLTSMSQADAGATVAPARDDLIRGIMHTCFEIAIGAETMIRLADHALENCGIEDHHQVHELAHSVDLLANEMRRRADLVYNFLENDGARSRANGHEGAGKHFEEIKQILRKRIEGWKAYSGIPLEGEPEAFRAAEHAAIEEIGRLASDSPLEAAMAKLIISKGTLINNELRLDAFCDWLEAKAAADGLEYFGLRELYDGYFPISLEDASC